MSFTQQQYSLPKFYKGFVTSVVSLICPSCLCYCPGSHVHNLLIMERYYEKTPPIVGTTSSSVNSHASIQSQISSTQEKNEVDLENLQSDPGLRPNILSYPPSLIEEVRRAYLLKGPCQPREHNIPQKIDGNRKRKFIASWFDEFNDWLEYNIAKDAAFCLYCYLFPIARPIRGHDEEYGNDDSHRAKAFDLLDIVYQFEFVFVLYLMRKLLGITHELSQVLQRKDQDIVNAMSLVKVAKARLQAMRDDGCETFLAEVFEVCSQHKIVVLEMTDLYVPRGRSRRNTQQVTNLHHYRYSLMNDVIDTQSSELNDRFNEVNTELLLCMACLDPRDLFAAFDKDRLLRLTKFYPSEFLAIAFYELESQLDNFIFYVRLDGRFSEVVGIGGLAEEMVTTRKHIIFPLVYLLIKLSLTLPVATATVERAFSAKKIVKSSLRNRMGDDLLNDCLVTYIEKDVFQNVSNEAIMQRFQNMKPRREML